MKRLPAVPGEWIDRERPLAFTFEGKPFSGFAGDVISSALAANGVRIMGRSFKYHRARGLLTLANADVNAMLQAGERLNIRGDVTALDRGLALEAVNTFGGVEKDRARWLSALSRFLPVGFYYKAFHSKRGFPFWERVIRRASGLGRVTADTPRVRTAKRYEYCDVLVIGGGASGLCAAIAAADAGLQVAIVDENARLGGSALFNLGADETQRRTAHELISRAQSHARIKTYASTVAAGYYADHWVPLIEPERITKMRARAVIFATGALEQPAVFRNNDLPGVLLASAAQRLIYRYAVAPGTRAVVLAANDDAYRAARDLRAHGVKVQAVVDLRSAADFDRQRAADELVETEILPGHGVYEAIARREVLSRVRVAPLLSNGELDASKCREIDCDLLLISTGWAPALNLLRQAGVPVTFDEHLSQFVPDPDELPEGLFACGRVRGVHDFADRCRDGENAGRAAARYLQQAVATPLSEPNRHPDPDSHPVAARRASHRYPIFSHPRGKNFVDFDEDLQLQDFFHAAQEGFDSIELLKRFSTFGMGPSQGKHSNVNASRVLAKILGVPVSQIGTPTSRPFYHPVPLGFLAGRAFNPERLTPLHSRHVALNAKLMAAGPWQRPEYYALPGQTREQAIHAEVTAVRERVGLIDVGTLGKIEAHGPDAGTLLERVYTGRFMKLKPGATRYGLMLDESGVVIDDGVIARFSDEHYYFTTTTSGSATVYRELQRQNQLWNLRSTLVNLTGHLGAVNLAGPRAREVLRSLCDVDLSDSAFPYLAARTGNVAGVAVRLLRVGFVGELGYEIHAPAESIGHIWDALMSAGASLGIRPFGVEAQRLLRLEKGHIIIGQDTDGLTNPFEIGTDWALALDKPFFVGQRSLRILAKRPARQKLVGFRLHESGGAKPCESHLVIADGEIAGRVTSVAGSPTLRCTIGLAFVPPALSEPGSEIDIRLTDGAIVKATVSALPFYDAQNSRQKIAEAA